MSKIPVRALMAWLISLMLAVGSIQAGNLLVFQQDLGYIKIVSSTSSAIKVEGKIEDPKKRIVEPGDFVSAGYLTISNSSKETKELEFGTDPTGGFIITVMVTEDVISPPKIIKPMQTIINVMPGTTFVWVQVSVTTNAKPAEVKNLRLTLKESGTVTCQAGGCE